VKLVLLLLAALSGAAGAADGVPEPGQGNCWVDAGAKHGVPSELLYIIAKHESRLNPMAVGKKNSDGSVDLGIMQINSAELPRLAKLGITRSTLLHNPCVNIDVGAGILAEKIRINGWTWEAVGAYNAKSKHKRQAYVAKIWNTWQQVLRDRYGDSARSVLDGMKVPLATDQPGVSTQALETASVVMPSQKHRVVVVDGASVPPPKNVGDIKLKTGGEERHPASSQKMRVVNRD